MSQPSLYWLPECREFRTKLNDLKTASQKSWAQLYALANHNLNFIQTNSVDAVLLHAIAEESIEDTHRKKIKLAILGSSTVTHLKAGIRVAALRRGFQCIVYEAEYGQYFQELSNRDSELHQFKPDIVLFALDAHHLSRAVVTSLENDEAVLHASMQQIMTCWSLAKDAFSCVILQQAALPCFDDLLGNNEHKLPGSKAWFIERLNLAMRRQADIVGAHIISIDRKAAKDGLYNWFDAALWHKSKQEIRPTVAPVYGDLVARVIAAVIGKSYKCLVLDLDNTLWGGVIGDDGLDGISLGQGSTTGEAFVEFQKYVKNLSERGIILAACSKNDENIALEVFEKHPEMVLTRQDIACFIANWDDKASNLRTIAHRLNIGLDAIVFADDNPFERALIKQELPMIAVPELPDDPCYYGRCIADAGYFEAITLTSEDRIRADQYQANIARGALLADVTDMTTYLKSLEMILYWQNFERTGLQRIVQLINKTNQFNLTTRRYTTEDVVALLEDKTAFGVQLRLVDKFGDNGVVAIIIGRMKLGDLIVDTWLMSCRVLGREVEIATLNIIMAESKRFGARRVIGQYFPTEKNLLVKNHYAKLGFSPVKRQGLEGDIYELPVDNYTPRQTAIKIERL